MGGLVPSISSWLRAELVLLPEDELLAVRDHGKEFGLDRDERLPPSTWGRCIYICGINKRGFETTLIYRDEVISMAVLLPRCDSHDRIIRARTTEELTCTSLPSATYIHVATWDSDLHVISWAPEVAAPGIHS